MPRSNEVRGKVSNFEEQTIKRMKLFTEENVTSESKISIIPVEVLIQIFESLSMKDIENCSNTCVEWRRIWVLFNFSGTQICLRFLAIIWSTLDFVYKIR